MMLIVVRNKILCTTSAEGVLEAVGKGYQLPLMMPVATSDPFLDLFHREAIVGMHRLEVVKGNDPLLNATQNLKL